MTELNKYHNDPPLKSIYPVVDTELVSAREFIEGSSFEEQEYV